MPALDALQDRFTAAHTVTLGISVDSQHCHAGWGVSMDGIKFPLLADFHPKGAVAESYGLYLSDLGITDRATVIIDAGGVVQHASSVGPGGERDIGELAALCEGIDEGYDGKLSDLPAPAGFSGDHKVLVRSSCGFSRAVLWARTNLHLEDAIPVANVTEDAAAMAELEKKSGGTKAPCLIHGDQAMLESTAIIEHLVTQATGWWS